MKRSMIAMVLAGVLSAGPVFAAQRGTPEYEKLKQFKKEQHDKKTTAPSQPNFWQREAERSGLAGTAAMLTHPLRVISKDSNNG